MHWIWDASPSLSFFPIQWILLYIIKEALPLLLGLAFFSIQLPLKVFSPRFSVSTVTNWMTLWKNSRSRPSTYLLPPLLPLQSLCHFFYFFQCYFFLEDHYWSFEAVRLLCSQCINNNSPLYICTWLTTACLVCVTFRCYSFYGQS